jgi:hypothetical protein
MVTAPVVGAPAAAFEITMLYVAPVSPATKLPVCDIAMERSGTVAGVMLVGSEAVTGLVLPPPATLAVFVRLAGALVATSTVTVMAG